MKAVQKESYWYWLKACALAALPQGSDWRGVLADAADLARSLWFAFGMTLLRLLILVTLPASLPILALIALRENQRVAEASIKARDELIDSLQSLHKKEPQ